MCGLPRTLAVVSLSLVALLAGGCKDSPSGPSTVPVPADVTSWLKQNTTQFATATPGSSDADLAVLGSLVGSAHVVALGEATHGTSEFFSMKQRVLRYLVQHMGFTAFAIEATFPEAEAMDEYVRTGKGDPAVLLSRLYFWTWNTQEVLDMIQWMRQYNQTVPAEKQVRFFGFDMQYPGAAADSLLAFVGRVDAGRGADSVSSAFACYRQFMNDRVGRVATRYSGASVEVKVRCRAGVQAAYDWVARHRAAYEAASSPRAFTRALQYARLVVQAEDMYGGTDGWARDRYMADNAGWLLDQLPAGSKIVLWAHNGHVQHYSSAMGANLKSRYGEDLVVLGFGFYQGSFNAVTYLSSGSYGGLTTHTAPAARAGSFELLFHSAGRPRMIVPLRSAANPSWLTESQLHRSIGAVYSSAMDGNFYVRAPLPSMYDALIYFDDTHPSVLLPFRYD